MDADDEMCMAEIERLKTPLPGQSPKPRRAPTAGETYRVSPPAPSISSGGGQPEPVGETTPTQSTLAWMGAAAPAARSRVSSSQQQTPLAQQQSSRLSSARQAELLALRSGLPPKMAASMFKFADGGINKDASADKGLTKDELAEFLMCLRPDKDLADMQDQAARVIPFYTEKVYGSGRPKLEWEAFRAYFDAEIRKELLDRYKEDPAAVLAIQQEIQDRKEQRANQKEQDSSTWCGRCKRKFTPVQSCQWRLRNCATFCHRYCKCCCASASQFGRDRDEMYRVGGGHDLDAIAEHTYVMCKFPPKYNEDGKIVRAGGVEYDGKIYRCGPGPAGSAHNQPPERVPPEFENTFDVRLDEALNRWAERKFEKKMAGASKARRDILASRQKRGALGLHVRDLVQKARKLQVVGSKWLPKEWKDRLAELDRGTHEEDDSEKQRIQVMEMIKAHLKAEQRLQDKESEKHIERLKKKQRDQKKRGVQKRDGGCCSVLYRCQGTVFTAICTDGDTRFKRFINSSQMLLSLVIFWVTRGIIYGFGDAANAFNEADLPPIKNLDILGSFLSFFLVFFASQSYNRFERQYACSMSCEGRIFDVCSVAQACLSPSEAHRLWRHINAAHVLAYVGLTETDDYSVSSMLKQLQTKHRLLNDNEWRKFVVSALDKETGRLSGGNAYRKIIAWAVHDVEKAREPSIDCLDWRPEKVKEWMGELELDGKQTLLAECFRSNRIDGAHLCRLAEKNADGDEELEHLIHEALRRAEAVHMMTMREMVTAHVLSGDDDDAASDTFNALEIAGYELDDDGGRTTLEEFYQLTKNPTDLRNVCSQLRVNTSTAGEGPDKPLQLRHREKLIAGLQKNLHFSRYDALRADGEPSVVKLAHVVRVAIQKKRWGPQGEQLSDMRADELVRHVLRLRGALGSLYDYKDQPVPFFYVHLLYLISAIYLPLFAYANALQWPEAEGTYFPHNEDYINATATPSVPRHSADLIGWLSTTLVGTIVIVLQNIIVIGLTKICEMLADPYGTDDADLAVKHFVEFTLQMSKEILQLSHTMGTTTVGFNYEMEKEEQQLQKQAAFGALKHDYDEEAEHKGNGWKDRLERWTGIDLDGDGDVGESGNTIEDMEHFDLTAARSPLSIHGSPRVSVSQQEEFTSHARALTEQAYREERTSSIPVRHPPTIGACPVALRSWAGSVWSIDPAPRLAD
jgi:hypothetical protein